jgi:hypothetical protein
MKKSTLPFVLCLFVLGSFSQRLSQVTLSASANLVSISFLTDQRVCINISAEGNLVEFGTEYEIRPMNYYPGKLQPFMGRMDKFGPESDSALRGKIKSIGTCTITYFSSYENKFLCGKIKTIGSNTFDYYAEYEEAGLKGKIKSAGSTTISFYPSYENEAYRGKLKSMGATTLSYYSSFDDKLVRGKIKSIGNFNYSWYGSNDRPDMRGMMKSGNALQMVNGINFINRYF